MPFLPPASATAPSSSLVGSPRAVAEALWDILLGPVHDLDELAGEAAVLLGDEEGDGGSRLSGTPSTADAVDVGVHVVGEVKVHDHPDVVDVEAAGGDVRGAEEGGVAVLELAKDPVTLRCGEQRRGLR